MKRYSMRIRYTKEGVFVESIEMPHGRWMKWEDYEAEVRKKDDSVARYKSDFDSYKESADARVAELESEVDKLRKGK